MTTANKEGLVLESSLQAFFFDCLSEINKKSTAPLSQKEIFYSSLVLDKFGETSQFYDKKGGKFKDKDLGIKLLESSHLPVTDKKRVLKDIGDTSLFLCGYFSDSLNRKIIDTSYYHQIGLTAYRQLDSLVPEYFDMTGFYDHISKSFTNMTNLIGIVSQSFFLQNDTENDFLLYSSGYKLKVG